MRLLDRRLRNCCWALGLFLVVHTFVPLAFAQSRRPSPSITPADLDSLNARVQRIEDLRLDARLSVLESIADEVRETRRVNYGIVAAVVGNLLLTGAQIRGQRQRRRRAEDEDDES